MYKTKEEIYDYIVRVTNTQKRLLNAFELYGDGTLFKDYELFLQVYATIWIILPDNEKPKFEDVK